MAMEPKRLPGEAISRGPRFGEGAARLAGLAGALLGWRPDEFWNATPAELAAILEAMTGGAPASASAEDLARLKERFPD
jgi:Phage tail assembly chaperone protein, TAC